MSGWWTKYPLPEGWEVKYHWETKRFFYVDHVNKVTVWNDPRIELYKDAEKGASNIREDEDEDESSKSSSSPKMTPMAIRESKAENIKSKFPAVPLTKIITLLESNYDNAFAVESKLNQEFQQAEAEKAEAREKEAKRKQEEEKKRVEEEKRKIEEALLRKEEERKKKVEADKKRAIEEEKKKVAEEIAKQKNEEENKKRQELELKKRQEEEVKKRQEEETRKKEEIKTLKEQFTKKIDKINESNERSKDKELSTNKDIQSTSKSAVGTVVKTVKKEDRPTSKSANQRGPDKALYSGADPQNVKGPNQDYRSARVGSLARGADPLNRCGPQMRAKCSAP